VQRRLDLGENVVLHCLGGLGRSGMIAARVLVERGLAPAAAITAVRAARPGAIETAQQEAYVLGLDRLTAIAARPGRKPQ
jgi:ADP-ribosyl-[dinitrogen reductase] hydrolase